MADVVMTIWCDGHYEATLRGTVVPRQGEFIDIPNRSGMWEVISVLWFPNPTQIDVQLSVKVFKND